MKKPLYNHPELTHSPQHLDAKLQNYITRYQLRNIFSVGQKSYLLDSYADYSKWYFTPEGKADQID